VILEAGVGLEAGCTLIYPKKLDEYDKCKSKSEAAYLPKADDHVFV
jgi:hypothetical protein